MNDPSNNRPAAADDRLDRRGLLRVTAATGAAAASAGFLAACGSPSSGSSGDANGAGSSSPAPSAGVPLASTGDIPVGGGEVLTDKNVVVTQPAAGTFKAFSAVCTHQGCTVGSVTNGLITCPCHGSQFSATDGSVRRGPAQSPLPSVPVRVQGNEVTTA